MVNHMIETFSLMELLIFLVKFLTSSKTSLIIQSHLPGVFEFLLACNRKVIFGMQVAANREISNSCFPSKKKSNFNVVPSRSFKFPFQCIQGNEVTPRTIL
jgi:hypothetical protein